MTKLAVFPHCDMHIALNNTGDLPFRVFRQSPTASNPMRDVTAACTFLLFAPYNEVGHATHDRLEQFVTIDPVAGTITPVATGINLIVVQHGGRYIVARIQVHNDIRGWWFGNASITTALDANVAHSQPSIYAMFSDDVTGTDLVGTDLVGDITGHGYVALTSSSNGTFTVASINNEGRLQGHAVGTASLTGNFLGISQSIPVKIVDYAQTRENLTTVRATDLDNFSEKHNILFLAEGFKSTDQAKFDRYVAETVDELFSKPRHEPFNLLEGSFNVFKAFQASEDHLVTCGFKVNDQSVSSLKKGRPIPYRDRVSDDKGKYTVEELVARVGLPLRNESRNEAQLKALWSNQSLHDYDERRVNGDLVKAWKNSTSLGFLEARDTYFGIILGRRWADNVSSNESALTMPASDSALDNNLAPLIERAYTWFNPRGTTSSLKPDPRRHPPELFEHNRESPGTSIMSYINGLQLIFPPHPQIGPEWVPDGTFKRSRGLIAMIVNDGMHGGTNFNDNTLFANTLNTLETLSFEYPATNTATKQVMRRKPPAEIPDDIDSIINVAAHEFGHSFNLGDEYERIRGDRADAPDGDDNIAAFNSIFLGSDLANNQNREIDPAKVKWHDLPRIEMCAALTQDSQTRNGQIEVTIDSRQISRWSKAKTQNRQVYLRRTRLPPDGRQLPLGTGDEEVLVRLDIGDINQNNGTLLIGGLELPPTTPFPVFPAGSLLFIHKQTDDGQLMFVMEKKVFDFINTNHLPLNKNTDTSEVNKKPDQPVDIPDFKSPCKAARLVGVYEGAARYTGLVYRPTGTCKMRNSRGEDEDGEYCHVCKWLIVNRIDASRHEILDRNFYPEAKKMTEKGAFEVIVAEIGKLLLPLQSALDSPQDFQGLLLKLGWNADAIPQPFLDLAPDLEILFEQLQKIVGGSLSIDGSVSLNNGAAEIDFSLEDVQRTIEAIRNVIDGIESIASAPNTAFPANLVADNFKDKFPAQLISYLFITYLRNHRSQWGFALQTLGVAKTNYVEAGGNRPPFVDYVLDFPDIPKIFENPRILLENAFGWGGDDFDFRALASQVDNLASSLSIGVVLDEVPTDISESLEGGADMLGDPIRKRLRMVFFERARNTGRLAAELSLLSLPKTPMQKPGFALMPAFNGLLDIKMQLGPGITVRISSDLDLQGGVGLIVRPDAGIEMILGFEDQGAPTHAKGSARVEVEFSNPDATPTIILGSGDGTRLQYQSVSGVGGIALSAGQDIEIFAEVEANGLAFIFDPSGSDGFISSILAGISTNIEFDLGLGLAYPRGVYFRGTSHLEIQVPTHISLGPIDVQGLTISITPQTSGIPIELGATFKVQLGPLAAVVENIGLRTDISFPNQGGNLGPVDLEFGLKPPNGIGLSVDAGVVKGGGYLYIDSDRGEYAGALELSFLEFLTLNAIAVITTKMPDGSDGFSLIAIINVEFNPGLQLGFGFTLIGVGGLLGLNRTMDLDALVEGVRTGSLDSVVFPSDVVANAPRIISDMRAFFPPEDDTFLIGPMAKFGWGTPTLISLSLGIIIEVPGNIAIVGTLKVALPDEKAALLVIKVAFMGAIEFDKKRGWFFANLYESRVIYMPLEGGMGVLAAFGNDPNFVVSVGGFHPSYNPPTLPFSAIARIAINILNTPVARVRIDAYFAVTANTVQFGARAELYFGISIARIEGHIAFDALFQFSPFYFIISISASLSVKVFGAGLFSVRFRGSLEGTSPWHVEGTGSISILFWDIGVDFSHTWGEEKNTTLPPISVMPIMAAEFEKLENWTAELAKPNKLLVSLRNIDEPGSLVLHPIGSLKITQRAIPLDLTIDKVGNQRPDDANRFTIDAVTSGIEKRGKIFESFAMGQFQDMGDGEKLSAADYEKEEAGLELAITGTQTRSSFVTKRIARYEQIIIDNNFKRAILHFVTLFTGLFAHFLNNNVVALSDLSAKRRHQMHFFDEKITVKPNSYIVANIADNAPVDGAPLEFSSRASAKEFMKSEIARDPSLAGKCHVIRPHEMKMAA